jgi:ABC-type transport system involved in multi-copper enzyme maturation permease subunit
MPIYPLTYRHWEGERVGGLARFLAFARTGAAALWQGRFRKWVVILSVMPVVVYGFFVYFTADFLLAEETGTLNAMLDFLGQDASRLIRENSDARAAFWTGMLYFYLTRPTSFCAMFVVVVMGAGLIAADRRHNAHEIYFARPVGWWDYVVGKLSVIGVYLGVVMLVPALLLWLMILLFSPQFSDVFFLLDLFPRLILIWLMWTVFAGLPMLAISSLGQSTGLSAFLWVVLWIGSQLVSGVAHGIYIAVHGGFERPMPRGPRGTPPEWMFPNWTEAFSFGDNLIAVQHGLIGGAEVTHHFGESGIIGPVLRMASPGVSPWLAFALVGGVALVSLAILRLRVRPQGAT